MQLNSALEAVLKRFTAPEFTLLLLALLTALVIPGTFGAGRSLYHHPMFIATLAVFALHLLTCTVKRWRMLAGSTLIIHAGVLVTLLGGMVSSTGYVATVNIYEGGSVDRAFRWDRQEEQPLGLRLTLNRINREYYPVPVRVGVLKDGAKYALIETRNGDSFTVDGLDVQVVLLDVARKVLELNISRHGKPVGTCDTAGNGELPAGFPYTFKLVGYQDPALKRIWLDLALQHPDQPVVSGVTEVNQPLSRYGLTFHHVQVDRDQAGAPYAGLQIVRDPGRPVAFAGFAIVAIGAVGAMFRRLHDI